VVKEKKNGQEVRTLVVTCPPMGADLIRWMFCRHNPAANINFGPGPAEELRSKFTLKLWNTYAFFCNYARLDGFDPAAPQVPVHERPDLDRWILSDLQKLIRTAREAFEQYDLMKFCLEAERFVDDKLSNWYVRRSRRRFWKSEQGRDKQAAYQTLYAVLTTLTKLFAPIMPFLTEAMYQNLSCGKDRPSVHLCNFPEVDDTLITPQLSTLMESLLRLVSLGLAARNAAKIKVRQPLAQVKIQWASDDDRDAIQQFWEQLAEELNVIHVTPHDSRGGPLLHSEVSPNMKTLGPKFGPRLKAVQAALAAADPEAVASKVQAGEAVELACSDGPATLEPADVVVQPKAPEGWVGVADRGTQVLIDTRITEELARTGMARDVVRQVQELRKKSRLEIEDRIMLYLDTPSERLRRAIDEHRAYIAGETLTAHWATRPLDGQGHCTTVKVDGQDLVIELRKVPVGES
jgi:isoleucyl-tRNA synthetase